MALLKRLVVSDSSQVLGSTDSDVTAKAVSTADGDVTTEPTWAADSGETSSEAEDNTRGKRRRNKKVVRMNVTPLKGKPEGLTPGGQKGQTGRGRNGQLKYKAVEMPSLSPDGEDSETAQHVMEDRHDSESSSTTDNARGKRKKKNHKSNRELIPEEHIDPLQLKYLELNELLMQDFVARKLSEHRGANKNLGQLYKACPLPTHGGRPPPVPFSQRGVMSHPTYQRQLQRDRITITGDTDSVMSRNNNTGNKISGINPISSNGVGNLEQDGGTTVGVIRRRRPQSATTERKSRADHAERHVGRSRSAGSRNRRRRKSPNMPNKSDRSESLSCGRTDNDTSTASSPRHLSVPIDCHLKNTQNDSLLQWLEQKNKLLRQDRQQRRAKKRQQRLEQMDKVTNLFERSVLSKKETEEWLRRKQKEAWLKSKEEKLVNELKNREEAIGKSSSKIRHVHFGDCQQKSETLDVPSFRNRSAVDASKSSRSGDKLSAEEEEQARKAAELRENGTRPPKTTFIYKRPVTGKIRFKMPKASKNEPVTPTVNSLSEEEKKERARMSYDQWLLGKRNEEMAKKKMTGKRDNVLAESDPMVQVLSEAGKRRVKRVMEEKRTLDTGVSSTRAVPDYSQQPDSKSSVCNDKTKPKPSHRSPRRVYRRLQNAMENDSKLNPFVLPFPPELGVPKHVAAKQREIFSDRVHKKDEDESTFKGDRAAGGDSPDNPPECGAAKVADGNSKNSADDSPDDRPEYGATKDADGICQNSVDDSENHSPRYGFNRRRSPVTTSSSDEDQGRNVDADNPETVKREGTSDIDVLNQDGIFLTSLET